MYNLWFKNHPANQKFADSIESTFRDGGYFQVNVTDNFSVLAFNTMQYNEDQIQDEIGPEIYN